MSFEDDKLNLAISTLKDVEKRCVAETGWLRHMIPRVFGTSEPPKPLAEQLETQIILADSQVCIGILTFLQQDISGYFKAGWVLRKAWKVYQRVYKDILVLYTERIGELHLPGNILKWKDACGIINEIRKSCVDVLNVLLMYIKKYANVRII